MKRSTDRDRDLQTWRDLKALLWPKWQGAGCQGCPEPSPSIAVPQSVDFELIGRDQVDKLPTSPDKARRVELHPERAERQGEFTSPKLDVGAVRQFKG